MIRIGTYNILKVDTISELAYYLVDEEKDAAILNNDGIKQKFEVGEAIKVFVYKDNDDRLIATLDKPKILLNEFTPLKVISVTSAGAFLDWGLPKDLFVPFKEQYKNLEEGETYLCYLYYDEDSERLAASTKLRKFLVEEETYEVGEEVNLLIWQKTDLGFKAIVNREAEGLLYHNEIFQELHIGQEITGYIKTIREDEKMDLVLQKLGHETIEPNAKKVLEILKAAGGALDLHDKSDPEEIKRRLQMSKKAFKKAIGTLYKQKLILIEQEGIRLNG